MQLRMFKLGTTKTMPSPAGNAHAPAVKFNIKHMAAAPVHDEPTATKSSPVKGRLSSTLKDISSTTIKIIKRASRKASRILSNSNSKGSPSRVRPYGRLTPYPGPAACDSSESSQHDMAYHEADSDSRRGTESPCSLSSSFNYPNVNLMTSGPLPAHDPGHTPSPYEDTGTSMEVCEWASCPDISTDIYAIRTAAARDDQTDGAVHRASCLNRADRRLYHVPARLDIRLPEGATGRMRLPLDYPRGAKGLKRPDDGDFPSWHRDSDGYMVPTPRLLQGVFLPEPSRLREVETVQSAESEWEGGEALARSLGQNVTLRSFRRTRSMVFHQSEGNVMPTRLAASVDEDGYTVDDAADYASLFSAFDGGHDICDTYSQGVSNEHTTQEAGFRRLPLTHAVHWSLEPSLNFARHHYRRGR